MNTDTTTAATRTLVAHPQDMQFASERKRLDISALLLTEGYVLISK